MIVLSARPAFNATVRHIKQAIGILEALEGGENFADALRRRRNEALSDTDSLSLLSLLLLDKLGYTALSANPAACAGDLPALAAEFARWEAVDLVAVFHAPHCLGIVNPKNAAQLAALGKPFPRELLVIYAGRADGAIPGELGALAARTAMALLSGERPEIPADLCAPPQAAPKRAAHAATQRPLRTTARATPLMTPLYSVTVSNELFHNGNVEAWKRVIHDYENARPGLKVHVYYGGERVLDINALFAWGKIKHGGSIQFAVSSGASGGNPAPAIRDTALLRRLLTQAAGRDVEPFLRGPSGGRLTLF
jgi:hypothetical protein